MTVLYMASGNALDSMGYASLNGYTMHREWFDKCSEWALRDPRGELVDHNLYRSIVAARNGFKLDEGDE